MADQAVMSLPEPVQLALETLSGGNMPTGEPLQTCPTESPHNDSESTIVRQEIFLKLLHMTKFEPV